MSDSCIEENILGNNGLKLMHSTKKGRYYLSTKKIKKGAIIFEEKPFLIIRREDLFRIDKFFQICLPVVDKLESLAPVFDDVDIGVRTDRQNDPSRYSRILFNKISTNGFNFGIKRTAMLYYGSFFNHSCDPNIAYEPLDGKMIFTALRDIRVGEELCISYIMILKNYDYIDRSKLLKHWNFTCGCIKCQDDKLYTIKNYLESYREKNKKDLEVQSVINLYELVFS